MSNSGPFYGSLQYLGTRAVAPSSCTFNNRDPNDYDNTGYSLMDLWLNEETNVPWILVSLQGDDTSVGALATWIPLTNGAAISTFLVDYLNNPAYPTMAGAINILGTVGQVRATATANTITLTMPTVTTGVLVAAGGAIASLANGTETYVLTITGGVPAWEPAAGGGAGTVTSVTGGDNINITGDDTVDPTVNLNLSIIQPQTAFIGGQYVGVYALGTGTIADNFFLHSFGDDSNTFVGRLAGNLTNITSAAEENFGGGYISLNDLTSGHYNTAVGGRTLSSATTASSNTAVGHGSLFNLITGTSNISIGDGAGVNLIENESNNILINNIGANDMNNTIYIGTDGSGNGQQDATFIAGIYNNTPVITANRIVTVSSVHQLEAITPPGGSLGYVLTLGVAGVPQWAPGGGGGGAVTSVLGSTNITVAPNVGNAVVTLNNSIQLPVTTADGTSGVIALGNTALPGGYVTNRFLSAYGTNNTFLGSTAGNMTVGIGANSTGIGYQSLRLIGVTGNNTALGSQSLARLVNGSNNTALGFQAGYNYQTIESSNITIGSQIGGTALESNTIRIGTSGDGVAQQNQTFIGGIQESFSSGNYSIVTANTNDKIQIIENAADDYVMTMVGGVPEWAPPAGGGGGFNLITTFTAESAPPGSYWVPNVNTKWVTLLGWNGGAGGGGGYYNNVSGTYTSGCGGSFGGGFYLTIPRAFFGVNPVPIQVGTGGAGGLADNNVGGGYGSEGTQTIVGNIGCPLTSTWTSTRCTGGGTAGSAANTLGRNGSVGNLVLGTSFFSSAPTGLAQFGGVQAPAVGNGLSPSGSANPNPGVSPGVSSASRLNNSVVTIGMIAASGGGYGGYYGLALSSAGDNIYNIGVAPGYVLAGGAGVAVNTNGNPGNPSLLEVAGNVIAFAPGFNPLGFICGGTGGGGGGWGQTAPAGNGGNGGFPGAGGGGGGSSAFGGAGNSGAGGAGANGYLIIIEN